MSSYGTILTIRGGKYNTFHYFFMQNKKYCAIFNYLLWNFPFKIVHFSFISCVTFFLFPVSLFFYFVFRATFISCVFFILFTCLFLLLNVPKTLNHDARSLWGLSNNTIWSKIGPMLKKLLNFFDKIGSETPRSGGPWKNWKKKSSRDSWYPSFATARLKIGKRWKNSMEIVQNSLPSPREPPVGGGHTLCPQIKVPLEPVKHCLQNENHSRTKT